MTEEAGSLEPTDMSNSGPYYHGTKADLKPGDLIRPGYRSNYGRAERTSPWVYMTATLSPLGAELARGDGPGRLYIVEPTGPFEDDPDLTDKKFPGNPTRSYRSRHPLRVVGEVTDWEPHPPEQIKAMMDAQDRLYAMQAERIAQIPSASEFDRIRDQADQLAHEWTQTPEYLGCMLLMLIRGTEAEVFSAVSYRSETLLDIKTFEFPRAIGVQPSWPQRDVPRSGRITDVGAWREGWVAVIESCVTEIGLSVETRIWIAIDAENDTLRFRVDADGPERSWQRNLQLVRGVLTDCEYGEIWDFGAGLADRDESRALRELLSRQLDWREAHVGFLQVMTGFPHELQGVIPLGFAHSGWQLLEHMRRAQADILDFCVNPDYVYPSSLEEYWPETAPAADESWEATVAAFEDDLAALKRLALDESLDLFEKVPAARSETQTIARELILVTDHNAYHLGQLVSVRRALGVSV